MESLENNEMIDETIDKRERLDPENRNGRAPMPEGVLVSAERSGLNLIRHIVESLTPFRTPGKVHIHERGRLIFHRTHHVFSSTTSPGRTHVLKDGQDRYKKVLLVIRDPRETFVRAYKKSWDRFKDYCDNVKYFDESAGEKLLIYYDDLVADDHTLGQVFEFFGIGSHFDLEKIPFLREDAVK